MGWDGRRVGGTVEETEMGMEMESCGGGSKANGH
jgi:hypothetical protein